MGTEAGLALEEAAALVARARRVEELTGAGISAESGIPTFRGEGGLWRQYDPVKVASIEHFLADPTAYWSVARERGAVAQRARPNPGHTSLAALEESGHLVAVVTQNTDGLHQDAGSRTVVELHGSGRLVQCLDCGLRVPRAEVQERLEREMPPRCRTCGGMHLKPTVVLFGEPLPAAALVHARDLVTAADVMLVVGTSLVVHPAAAVPVAGIEAGVPLVIVNAEPTPLDHLAAAVVRGRSGELLPRLAELVSGG